MLESMRSDPDRGLYCFDWETIGKEIDIWSVTEDEDYQRWEFVLLPCNYIHAEFNDVGDTVHPDCIADEVAQQTYLGNMKSIIYID